MEKASSAMKVATAARTGGGRTRRGSPYGVSKKSACDDLAAYRGLHGCLDCRRAGILGWKPWTTIEAGTTEVLRWFESCPGQGPSSPNR